MMRGDEHVTTEQAGIPENSAVAQQVHHAVQKTDRKPRPEPAAVAAPAIVKPGADLSWLRSIGKAIACVLRPYPIDDADPRGSVRRLAVVFAGTLGVLALLVGLRRAR